MRPVPATSHRVQQGERPAQVVGPRTGLGLATDLPTSAWSPSAAPRPRRRLSRAARRSRMLPRDKGRHPAWTAPVPPVDRSSSTVTSMARRLPAARATTLPMYPAPPVTSSFIWPPGAAAPPPRAGCRRSTLPCLTPFQRGTSACQAARRTDSTWRCTAELGGAGHLALTGAWCQAAIYGSGHVEQGVDPAQHVEVDVGQNAVPGRGH